MNGIFERIAQLALTYDKPDSELVRSKNVKLGLRNADGTGVVVGITSKGQVIGYEKIYRKGDDTDVFLENNIHIPGLPEGMHVSPALAVYYILNGKIPDEKRLKIFEIQLKELVDYEVKPINGKLFYCGYNLIDLVHNIQKEKRFGFDEITYLLLTGQLPTVSELKEFSIELTEKRALPSLGKSIIMHESLNNDQMSALHTIASYMSRFDTTPNSTDLKDVIRQCIDLIAKLPTIVAYNYNAMASRNKRGIGLIEPRDDLSTTENFLYMLNGEVPDKEKAHILDLCLTLHADHGGGNNSTFTVRTVSSSGANTYMSISAGIASLSGHLHGGANEAVMRMMDDIKHNVKDWKNDREIETYIEKILKKEAGDGSGKIYGIGHAVYTLSDPRAILLEKKARKLAQKMKKEDEFNLYKKVADISCRILKEEKGIIVSPNVDFYSGFVYDAIGIPTEIFTPIFAMARGVGWCAHRIEQLIQGKIMRPAYASSLSLERKYLPLQNR